MDALTTVKNLIPDFAKDIRLNIDGVIARSSLAPNEALGAALAAAFAAKSPELIAAFRSAAELPAEEANAALTAAALMGMNNVYYPFTEMSNDAELRTIPAGLRMNAYATHGGVSKKLFELYALAASIVGKCHFCVSSHYATLKQEGLSTKQLQDIGKIASVVNAAAQIIAAKV
jgi:alkyl hydroperoxide reductase subunit D